MALLNHETEQNEMKKFSKTSQNVFNRKDVSVWIFEENGEVLVDITERASKENEISTAQYSVEQTGCNEYEFTLATNWSDRTLPELVKGETAFRQMIAKF